MKKDKDMQLPLVGKTHLGELLETIDEEYKEVYSQGYTKAENELIKQGELADSLLGQMYCKQAGEAAVLEFKMAQQFTTVVQLEQQKQHRPRANQAVLYVRKALQFKQLAASSGQDEVFERVRLAMLLAYGHLLTFSSPSLLEQVVLATEDSEWVKGDKPSSLATDFLDMSVRQLADKFLELVTESNKDEVREELLKAALKNARISKSTKEEVDETSSESSNKEAPVVVF